MTRSNGQHAPPSAQDRSDRSRTILVLVVVGLAALAVGVFLGSRRGDETTSSTTSPASSVTPSPAQTSAGTPSASPDDGSTPTTRPTPAALDEGRHFVLAEEVVEQAGQDALVVDLGYFLTGDDANEAAAEDGVETPLPNGYYIVNDNPALRTVPIASDATVRFIPADPCCDLRRWDLDAWKAAVNGRVMTDMLGEMSTTWWWVTVQDGSIVEIEQQYLP